MKTNYIILFTFFIFSGAIAQKNYNLEFFTQETAPFTVFINGVQQHETPTKNVRIEDFVQPVLKLRITFSDNQDEITKTLYMPEQSSEIAYQIKNTKKGIKVRLFSAVALQEFYPVNNRSDFIVVPYATVPVVSHTTTTTTTTGKNSGVNVGLNGDKLGVNVSINVDSNGGYYEQTTTTTTTSTVTNATVTDHYILEGYNGRIGCPWPITEADFQEAKRTIANTSFDDTKLGLAKQLIQSNCMFADQVRDLVALMSFDDSQLELAKFAYGYTYDPGNYFKVSQAFNFESSVEELNEYIANYRW